MTPTPINAVQYLAAGSKIEAIEGTITKVYPERSTGTNAHGEWSFQKASFRGTDGNEIKLKFDGFAPIGTEWAGHPMRIRTGADPKSKSIVVEEYQGKKSVKINGTATIEWNPPDMAAPAAHAPGPPAHAPAPPSGPPQYAPPPSGPPAHAQAPYSPPPQHAPSAPAHAPAPPKHTGPMPIQGATVGMAIKLAGDFIIADLANWPVPGSPAFATCLYQIASDILRVSERLGDGRLAPSATERLKRGEKTKTEPDYSHAPPPNAAEWNAQGQPAQPAAPPPAFAGGNAPGPDDDDIPF